MMIYWGGLMRPASLSVGSGDGCSWPIENFARLSRTLADDKLSFGQANDATVDYVP